MTDYSAEERRLIAPFFTNLDRPVYAPLFMPPELVGALCSRASRAKDDLRVIFLKEYVLPFINPVRDPKDGDEVWGEKVRYCKALGDFVSFLDNHSPQELFSNPRARSFYITWLAQYGDDSIAQMAGTHLVFTGLSQVAIKHFEDQRIGLAPIEKSTRYVNYGARVKETYLYYTDPAFHALGLEDEYRQAMDGLFDAYNELLPLLTDFFKEKFPVEKGSVVEKKVFDTLRGLLPTSALSQVAFFGNGQAFEYMISRSLRHGLGEIRSAGASALRELCEVTPAFLRRLKDEEKREIVLGYEEYLAGMKKRTKSFLQERFDEAELIVPSGRPSVSLLEYDPDGEDKVIAAILYGAETYHGTWKGILEKVRALDSGGKRRVLDLYLRGRDVRWQKAGRAFEHAYVRFEIVMNIGGWRDLHRHRMLSQERQYFSCHHGFDVSEEIKEAGFLDRFSDPIRRAEEVFYKIEPRDPELAQYVPTLAHRIRFMQFMNLRQCFWEGELRTIPEGHPDYRHIEQEKFRLLQKAYPLIAERMMVNMGEYDFARRGQEERIQDKLRKLGRKD